MDSFVVNKPEKATEPNQLEVVFACQKVSILKSGKKLKRNEALMGTRLTLGTFQSNTKRKEKKKTNEKKML